MTEKIRKALEAYTEAIHKVARYQAVMKLLTSNDSHVMDAAVKACIDARQEFYSCRATLEAAIS